MPGSFASSAISRWIGGAYTAPNASGRRDGQAGLRLHPRQAEPAKAATRPAEAARDAAELRRRQLLRRADSLVHRGEDHVLEELRVVRVDRLRADLKLQKPQIAAH